MFLSKMSFLQIITNHNPLSTTGANKPQLMGWAGVKCSTLPILPPYLFGKLRETTGNYGNLRETTGIFGKLRESSGNFGNIGRILKSRILIFNIALGNPKNLTTKTTQDFL